MERSTKTETVYIDLDYCNLEDCIKNLKEAFDKVPEKLRDSARFHIDYGEEYGSPYAHQQIEYQRPETDEEFNQRKAWKENWEARRIADAKRILGIKE